MAHRSWPSSGETIEIFDTAAVFNGGEFTGLQGTLQISTPGSPVARTSLTFGNNGALNTPTSQHVLYRFIQTYGHATAIEPDGFAVIPLPASAWMGIALLGILGATRASRLGPSA